MSHFDEEFSCPYPYLKVKKWLGAMSELPAELPEEWDDDLGIVWSYWFRALHLVLQRALLQEASEKGLIHPVDRGRILPWDELREVGIEQLWRNRVAHVVPTAPWWKWIPRAMMNPQLPSKRWPKSVVQKFGVPVASSRSCVLDDYLRKEKKVCAVWDNNWFFAKSDHQARKQGAEELGEEVIRRANRLISEQGIELDLEERLRSECLSFMNESMGYVHQAKNRLEKLRSSDVPKVLFGPTPGDIHERILRTTVRARGGEVIGVDHGIGVARVLVKEGVRVNFRQCDHYIAMDQWSEERFRSLKDDDLPRGVVKPKTFVRGADMPYLEPAITECPRKASRILLTPNMLYGWRAMVTESIPDICDFFLTRDLARMLTDAGYEVTIKPHPGASGPWDYQWLEREGVSVSRRSFEEEMTDHGALVNFSPSSTISVSCAKAGFPTVLVALPSWEYPVENFLNLRNIVAVVDADMQESGRYLVNAEKLIQAVGESVGR